MKLEINWKQKTLENLEKSIWDEPKFSSNLVIKCYKLRKKLLKNFEAQDLRIMIGQNFSLKYLIPLAIEELNKDILIESDLFEGDLLSMVLTSEVDYWKNNKTNWKVICDLFEENITKINDFCYEDNLRNELEEKFEEFKSINI